MLEEMTDSGPLSWDVTVSHSPVGLRSATVMSDFGDRDSTLATDSPSSRISATPASRRPGETTA